MSATESTPRVVLLARPGAASDRVRAALNEAGAEVVLEAEPARTEPADVQAMQPHVVMVVWDAVPDRAFERFEPVLAEAGIEIMFEEADIAAAREGWDAARWIRHLAAKLHRHDNVLPPGATPDDAHHTVPSGVGAQPDEPVLSAFENTSDAGGFETATFATIAEPVAAHPLSDEFTTGVEAGGFSSFDPVSAEMVDAESTADQVIAFDFQSSETLSLDDLRGDGFELAEAPVIDLVFDSERAEANTLEDFGALDFNAPHAETAYAPVNDFAFDAVNAESGALDVSFDGAHDVAPVLDVSFDAAPAAAFDLGFDAAPVSDAAFDVVAEPAAPAPVAGGMFSSLELATDDAPIAARPVAASGQFSRDLGDLEKRISSLELVDHAAPPKSAGAVLVLAGIGGPDAVRQLLGALPQGFPRPVLVQQRLDGGRYDKLVTQMQRASALPVELAAAGISVQPGIVYMLPAGVCLKNGGDGLLFDVGDALLEVLPPADSAVLLLSGADQAMVPLLTDAAWQAGFVAGQAPEDCYDAVAPAALAAAGGQTARPTELASRLAERWAH